MRWRVTYIGVRPAYIDETSGANSCFAIRPNFAVRSSLDAGMNIVSSARDEKNNDHDRESEIRLTEVGLNQQSEFVALVKTRSPMQSTINNRPRPTNDPFQFVRRERSTGDDTGLSEKLDSTCRRFLLKKSGRFER